MRQAPAHWFEDRAVPLAAALAEPLFAGAGAMRRALYRMRVLRAGHPGVPVIVVGNLIAGGAGKTPLTIALVERLRRAGYKPGVATRGYGRAGTAPAWATAESPADDVGDEPLLIARQTGVSVRVDRRRARAAQVLADAGCNVVVCDDGLQHYALARDIEIEVIDGRRRYGNGRLMPAGPLREPAHRGHRCDFRVLNLPAGAAPSDCGFGEWPMRLDARTAHALTGGRPRALELFAGQRVHAVAGIGDPERFFSMLRGFGMAVVPHAFPDHHRYLPADLDFASKLPILMTEKDAMKMPAAPATGFNLAHAYSVPVKAELPEAFWLALLSRLDAARGAGAGA